MSILDKFVSELSAAVPAGSPEAERLEAIFHAMLASDNPIVVDECENMSFIARQQLPLRERLRQLLDLMEGRLQ